MTLSELPQLFIGALGIASIYLTTSKRREVRFRGCLCGLAAQPFWLWMTIEHAQYAISALSLVYAFGWIRGLKNNWKGT